MAISWVALGAANGVQQWTAYRLTGQGDRVDWHTKPIFTPQGERANQHEHWAAGAPYDGGFIKDANYSAGSITARGVSQSALYMYEEATPAFPYTYPQVLHLSPVFDDDDAPEYLAEDTPTYGGQSFAYAPITETAGGSDWWPIRYSRQETPLACALSESAISDIAQCVYPSPVAYGGRGFQGHGFWTNAAPTHAGLVPCVQPGLFGPPLDNVTSVAYTGPHNLRRQPLRVMPAQGVSRRLTVGHDFPRHKNYWSRTNLRRGWYAWDGHDQKAVASMDVQCRNRWAYRYPDADGYVRGCIGHLAHGLPSEVLVRALSDPDEQSDWGESYTCKTYLVWIGFDEQETDVLLDTTALSSHDDGYSDKWWWIDKTIAISGHSIDSHKGFRLEARIEDSAGNDVTNDYGWTIIAHAKCPCSVSPWPTWSDPDTGAPYCPGWWMYDPS